MSGSAAETGQLDASPALFAVMAAINAAGYDVDLGSPVNSPVREMVRREVAAKNPAGLAQLKEFFGDHRQKDPNADLTQYISFALCVGDPPEFAYRYKTNELPPDVAQLDEFRGLMIRFYQEADIEQLWKKAQPLFEETIARYHAPVLAAVNQVNAYLRSSTSGMMGTRFQVYLDLVAAPNQVHTRSYKSDYFIVITPSAELQVDDIRHAFLHYQVDPLSIRYAQDLEKKRGLIDYAQAATLLEPYYKDDFGLLSTECLIKAIESRLAPVDVRPKLVAQALGEGYVMTPAFADALPAYEKQEQSLRFYYPDLVKTIDLKREAARLDKIEFATERPRRTKVVVPVEQKAEPTGVAKTLDDAEKLYKARDLEKAKEQYLLVLKQPGDRPLHAKAYYGLARVAALQNDPETAEGLFHQTVESSPEPEIAAWAYVYLGRLADASGRRDEATVQYKSALGIAGGSAAAKQAAQKGLEKAFTRN